MKIGLERFPYILPNNIDDRISFAVVYSCTKASGKHLEYFARIKRVHLKHATYKIVREHFFRHQGLHI